MDQFIASLVQLDPLGLKTQEPCPICLIPFAELDDPATKLQGCGHYFCLADLTEWIKCFHGNCPTCRTPFLDIRPPSDSDNESSDGGEYLPAEDEDDEDEEDIDHDGFTSEPEEFDVEGMDWETYRSLPIPPRDFSEQDSEIMDWGLTDDESESDPQSEGFDASDSDNGVIVDLDLSAANHMLESNIDEEEK